MKQIDKYVNDIYKDVAGDKQEIQELKQEMRSHLLEAVEELKEKGKTEDDAVRLAIENFGSKHQLVKGLSEFFKVQRKLTIFILWFALIFFVLGVGFLTSSLSEAKEFTEKLKNLEEVEQEKEDIMNDVLDALDTSNEVTAKEKEQLLDVFNKYQNKLNLIAVFSTAGSEKWLTDNEQVKERPYTRFPIDYSKATIVLGDNSVIENKEGIVPSDYDLGTVIYSNEQWIVQYEYKEAYEGIIEIHHQLKYYGPSIWDIYKLPILFFALFSVLGIVWLFLKKQNRQLKTVLN